MKSLLVLLLSLVAIPISDCSPNAKDILQHNSHNLRLTLNWLYEFGQFYQAQKTALDQRILSIIRDKLLPEYHDIVKDLSQFFTYIIFLRQEFVTGDVGDISISCDATTEVANLMAYLFVLDNLLTELYENIPIWKDKWISSVEFTYEGDPNMRYLTVTTDPLPFDWFQAHGFNDTSLKRVEILAVEWAMQKVSGNGAPLDRLLQAIATSALSYGLPSFSASLAWLSTVAGSTEATDIIESYLKSITEVTPQTRESLICAIRDLGEGPLSLKKLLGRSPDDGLFTWFVQLYKHSFFKKQRAGFYIKRMFLISKDIIPKLRQLREMLKLRDVTEAIAALREQGFDVSSSKITDEALKSQIHALIIKDGPLIRLCKALLEYAVATGIEYADERNGHAKATSNEDGKSSWRRKYRSGGDANLGSYHMLVLGVTLSSFWALV